MHGFETILSVIAAAAMLLLQRPMHCLRIFPSAKYARRVRRLQMRLTQLLMVARVRRLRDCGPSMKAGARRWIADRDGRVKLDTHHLAKEVLQVERERLLRCLTAGDQRRRRLPGRGRSGSAYVGAVASRALIALTTGLTFASLAGVSAAQTEKRYGVWPARWG